MTEMSILWNLKKLSLMYDREVLQSKIIGSGYILIIINSSLTNFQLDKILILSNWKVFRETCKKIHLPGHIPNNPFCITVDVRKYFCVLLTKQKQYYWNEMLYVILKPKVEESLSIYKNRRCLVKYFLILEPHQFQSKCSKAPLCAFQSKVY